MNPKPSPRNPCPDRTDGDFRWFRGEWPALLGLLALILSIYRRHLSGEALFLGNFDRLNSFLNTLWLQVQGWQTGHTVGWDDSMFMGRNLHALPFTYANPLNYLVSLFPNGDFFWVAGLVTILLHTLAGWCAYWFIHDVCRDRWAAFCGAVLYQFSALAVLKASQNDMSFAVLIDIPLLLLVLRRLESDRFARGLLTLSAVLFHLLVFCFLQKVAYALLLAGFYAVILSWERRSWRPLLTLAAAVLIASIAAFPRIYGILQELKTLQRQISPDFDMKNFAALYQWQNFRAFDVWRWFSDGLYGRFFTEVFALHNNLNITEGMLLCCGMLPPFLILGGLVRWEGRWGGLFRQATAEVRLFYLLIALAMGVVTSMAVYRVFWELFLRLDFTHTRFLIAALLPQCTLVALIIAGLRRDAGPGPGGVRLAAGLVLGVAACAGVYYFSGLPQAHVPVALTTSWIDALLTPIRGFSAILQQGADPHPPHAPAVAWLNAAILNRVVLTALLALLLACLALWPRSRQRLGAGLAFFIIGFMAADGWSYANLQFNGKHVQGSLPFYSSHSYWPARGQFLPPSPAETARVRQELEGDAYRVVLLSSTRDLPLFTAPHIAPVWNLRVVEGYSNGVPIRLAALPWPNWALGLRTMTFAAHQETEMPWGLLGFTNVKQGIRITAPLYRLGPGSGAPAAPAKVIPNPARVTPRVFVPQNVAVVASMAAARKSFFPTDDPKANPALDPVLTSLVEADDSLPVLDQTGTAEAIFGADEITLRTTASPRAKIVVLNELFHPDWRAYAGGRETTIYPINVLMRGVLVPAGATEVILRFKPWGRPANLLVAGVIALALAFLVIGVQRKFGTRLHRATDQQMTRIRQALTSLLPLGRRYWPALGLAGAALVLMLPLMQGRAWNAIGPFPFNPLNPPENYAGPVPEVQITAESWGASGVMVPFHARLKSYLKEGYAPSWNPYQGLGQPFAAQGEGCPYSPVAIIRALLPATCANGVTIIYAALGALAMFAFLRELGLARPAAMFGAVAFLVSGAVTLHLARPNLLEQNCAIPMLFWAAARAIRLPTNRAGILLALFAAVHLLGGFIQIAMLSGLLCAGFIVFYARLMGRPLRQVLQPLLWFTLGNGLGLLFLLPLIEAMQGSVNKNVELLAMIPMPYANVIAFYFPAIFGQLFHSWIPGHYPDIVNWDNLFAFAGTLPVLLILAGLSRPGAWPRQPWVIFAFFAGATLFLQLRYISFPPLGAVNLLPILGRQSPKHAGGLMVFTSLTAAALALQYLHAVWSRRALVVIGAGLLALASCLAVLVVRQGGWSAMNLATARFALGTTAVITGAAVLVITATGRGWWQNRGTWLAVALVLGEGLFYLPLGSLAPDLWWSRLVLLAVILLAGFTFAAGRLRAGLFIAAAAVVLFAGFIIPRSRLPLNVKLTVAPAGIAWLNGRIGDNYRAFGIHPDSSSIWKIQDLDVLGPLVPVAYADFLKLITTEQEYTAIATSYTFMLATHWPNWRYALTRYHEKKALFDAAGVRYLFLDKAYFGPGKWSDESFLLAPEIGMRIVYDDARVRILESAQAVAKFRFTPAAGIVRVPGKKDALERARLDPRSMLGPAVIETTQAGEPTTAEASGQMTKLDFTGFTPNEITVRVATSGAGLLASNDLFDPGWQVEIDGRPATMVRTHGIFRAVWVPAAGVHEVRFHYLSIWEKRGRWLSLLTALFLLVVCLRGDRTGPGLPRVLAAAGWLLATAAVLSIGWAYFGSSLLP